MFRAINNTKIKYLSATEDKVYEVTDIDFANRTMQAVETDLLFSALPEEEVFNVSDFQEFHITLRNRHGNVINFAEYAKNRKGKS